MRCELSKGTTGAFARHATAPLQAHFLAHLSHIFNALNDTRGLARSMQIMGPSCHYLGAPEFRIARPYMKSLLKPSLNTILCCLIWSCGTNNPAPRTGAAAAKCSPTQGSTYLYEGLSLSGSGYNGQVQQLINNKCAIAGCHNSTKSPNLTGYTNAKAASAKVYATTVDKSPMAMPPGGALSADEQALISAWKASGFSEDGTTPPSTSKPEPTPSSGTEPTKTGSTTAVQPTWDTDIKSVLATSCTKCHTAGKQPPDLTQFNIARAKIKGIMERTDRKPGSQGFMPKGQTEQMALALREKMATWDLLGQPENQAALPRKSGGSGNQTPCK